MHGHQIRRRVEIERAEFWGKVKVSSLYAALHRMEEEGLIEAIETRTEGRFPARTVYAITEEGRRELAVLREASFRTMNLEPDPLDLALTFSSDMGEGRLRALVEERVRALEAMLESGERQREEIRPYLTPMDEVVIDHVRLRVEAELRWHRELLGRLADAVEAPGMRVVDEPGAATS
jgi:DNA-binding PadR family transcriptional regulator